MSAAVDSAGFLFLLPWAAAALQLVAVVCAFRLGNSAASRRAWFTIGAGLLLLAFHHVLVAHGSWVHETDGASRGWESAVDVLAALVLSAVLARAALLAPASKASAQTPPAKDALATSGRKDALATSERKDALATSERKDALATAERLDALFRFAPDAIFLCATDGTILDANDSAAAVTGIAREDLVGLPGVGSLTSPAVASRAVVEAGAAAAEVPVAAGGQGRRELRRPDGRRVWLDVRSEHLEVADEQFLLVSARDVTERRRLEEQALGQENRFGFILDNLPAYVWTTDRTLRVTSARGRGLEALGARAEDLIGLSIEEIFPAGSLREMLVAMHRRVLVGEYATFRRKFRGRLLDVVMSSIVDEGGPPEVIGIVLDVTDRAVAESEARASSLRLNEILDHAPVMALIKDLDLRITYVNREWESVTGILQTTALGNSASGLLPAAVAELVEAHDREVLSRGQAVAFTEEVGVGTRKRSFSAVKFPLQNPDGSSYAVCALLREVTDEVAIVEELRRRTLLLDEAQTMAGLGNWEWDLVTGRRYWSPHLFALLGLDPAIGAEAAYDAYLGSVPEDEKEMVMEQTIAGIFDVTFTRFEHRTRFADGSLHWLRLHSRIDRNDAGAAIRVCGFAQDITAEREASEQVASLNEKLEDRVARRTAQIEDAIKELSTFSYAVSHDLRQPLRAIAGYLAMMEEDVGASLAPGRREYLDQVQSAARRMDATIDALLSLTRLTRATLHRDEIDASAMAREVATELEVADPSRIVRWQIEPGVTVHADRGLFRIVLQNLLGNAFKFTRDKPEAHIAFGCERRDGAAVFFVRDDGAGFDAASARRLFQPFQRMHDAREFEGTGIGLATVARIVQRHGGWLRADSSVGLGATFRFHLPEFAESVG